ncbi:MAG: TatD family hydrolase [Ruminococcus sp.]|nr:TatD family hydrolase [Ruminococcus sp.]
MRNIFDSHCHYNDPAFDEDRYLLLDRMLSSPDSPIDKLTHAATDVSSSRFGIELAKKYKNFYTSIGFHPEVIDDLPDDWETQLEQLYKDACVTQRLVAVGEIGLDYHYEGYNKAKQIALFEGQVQFALKKSLPIIVHCRDAVQDCMDILHRYQPRGVMHCFSGSAETALEVVKLGMYVGFTGSLAFKNNKKGRAVIAAVPLDRILFETDCPYMAPPPYRGHRSESYMIEEVAKVTGEVRGIDPQKMIDITNENACRLFGIK